MINEWLIIPLRLDQAGFDRLRSFGVEHEALVRCGYLTPARVRIDGNLFDFDEDGIGMLVQPVWIGPIPSPHELIDDPILGDLIAWRLDDPDRWYWRRGEHGLVLGDDNLSRAEHFHEPIRIYRNPLNWLRGRGAGALLLDNSPASLDRLRRCGEVIADDFTHGVEVENRLHQPAPNIPLISIIQQEAA